MEHNKPFGEDRFRSLPQATTSDLRDRQSVRATFKLTEACIDAISIVAAHLGIKQKSLFDHLLEDSSALNLIAREIKNIDLNKRSRIQKTYVISRKTLRLLEEVSKIYNAPRDALVELSVLRLLPVIEKEREKHEKRKELLVELTKHYRAGEKILAKTRESLGAEDPVFTKLQHAMAVYESAYSTIKSYIEKGKLIEEFVPGSMKRFSELTKEN